MVDGQFGDGDLAGVAEARAGAEVVLRLAIGAVGVELGDRAGGVGLGHHRAALVGVQPAAVSGPRALVPDDRLVGAGALHIAAQQGSRAIVLGRQPLVVVEEPRGHRRAGADRGLLLVEPAQGIIGQGRDSGAGRPASQAVLLVVGEAPRPGAVLGGVAVGVIAAGGDDGRVAVEAVGGGVGRPRRMVEPVIGGVVEISIACLGLPILVQEAALADAPLPTMLEYPAARGLQIHNPPRYLRSNICPRPRS